MWEATGRELKNVENGNWFDFYQKAIHVKEIESSMRIENIDIHFLYDKLFNRTSIGFCNIDETCLYTMGFDVDDSDSIIDAFKYFFEMLNKEINPPYTFDELLNEGLTFKQINKKIRER